MNNDLISRKELAKKLQVNINTVRKMSASGRIPTPVIMQKGVSYYDRQAIEKWLEESPDPVKKRGFMINSDGTRARPKKYQSPANFVYTGIQAEIIRFLKPGLNCRNSQVG